jgi:hypothetical protein
MQMLAMSRPKVEQVGEKERTAIRSSFKALYKVRVVRGAMVMSMERKKVMKEVKKLKKGTFGNRDSL